VVRVIHGHDMLVRDRNQQSGFAIRKCIWQTQKVDRLMDFGAMEQLVLDLDKASGRSATAHRLEHGVRLGRERVAHLDAHAVSAHAAAAASARPAVQYSGSSSS